MTKTQNAFKECANFEDVVSVIRNKCVSIRGGKNFSYFEASKPRVSYGVLYFHISASYTKTSQGSLTWYQLLLGESRLDLKVDNTYRGDGFRGIIRSSGGSHARNGRILGYTVNVSISLKCLPKIKKLVRQNTQRKNQAHAIMCSISKYPYTKGDKQTLQEMKALEERVEAWKNKKHENYIKKFPQIDLVTGKPSEAAWTG